MRARTSQAAISRIERGLVSPSVAMLERLLDLTGERLVLSAQPVDDGIDRSLLRANLERTPEERIEHVATFSRFVDEIRGKALAGR
jgi:transcriptional regulator with XRE-family HTH domain